MPSGSLRIAASTLARACLLAALASPGCQWFPPGALRLPGAADADRAAPAHDAAGKGLAPGGEERVAGDRKRLADPTWTRCPPASDPAAGAHPFRWQHAGIEEMLSRPVAQRPDFHAALRDRSPVVAANAAMALARLGSAAGASQLVAAVRNPDYPSPLRCAAIESLAALPAEASRKAVEELLEQYGNCDPQRRSTYLGDLHAELIRALARQVDAGDDPHFAAALQSPAAAVRCAAVEACTAARPGPLTDAWADLRTDSDPQVRAAAMRLLGKRPHPQSHAWLAAAATGSEPLAVRLAAIAALGDLGGGPSRSTLNALREHQPEMIRAAAVTALAVAGARPEALQSAQDRSWVVRSAVADAAARYPDREGQTLVEQLLDDPSAEVQRRAVAAVHAWPLERAGPVLLAALEKPGYLLRRAAAQQLAAAWRPAREFPIDGPPERRREVLQRLRQQFAAQVAAAAPPPIVPAVAAAVDSRPAPLDPQRVAAAERWLATLNDPGAAPADRRQALRVLTECGAELVPILEQLTAEKQVPVPEAVYREVLPKAGPAFAELERLTSTDLLQRRAAAQSLAALAGERPLRSLAAARLAALVARETDGLVWQSALAALEHDPNGPAIELAYVGLGHAEAEVRRHACLNLAAHPDPRHVPVLAAALDDPSSPVVFAAVQALAAIGRLDDPAPLRRLIATPNELLRVEVAAALCRIGDPSGVEALRRLAYSLDPAIRRRAAIRMGELADPRFVPILVELLDDRLSVRQAALESLPQASRQSIAQPDDLSPVDTNEQVRRWKRWYEQSRWKQ